MNCACVTVLCGAPCWWPILCWSVSARFKAKIQLWCSLLTTCSPLRSSERKSPAWIHIVRSVALWYESLSKCPSQSGLGQDSVASKPSSSVRRLRLCLTVSPPHQLVLHSWIQPTRNWKHPEKRKSVPEMNAYRTSLPLFQKLIVFGKNFHSTNFVHTISSVHRHSTDSKQTLYYFKYRAWASCTWYPHWLLELNNHPMDIVKKRWVITLMHSPMYPATKQILKLLRHF